jgi:large subunit ribosomal protein L4
MNTKTTIQLPVIGATDSKEQHAVPVKLFGQQMNSNLLTQYIQMYLVNIRQGTASTKDRSQINGTTKKMYKQKGTGNARHGSKKAPIFVGGGVVGGPKPKDYYLKMNKKQKTQAFVSALSQRAVDGEVAVFANSINDDKFKTKDMANILHAFAADATVTVVLNSVHDTHIERISRNLKKTRIVYVQSLNPYDVLHGKRLIFSESALNVLVKTSKA